jgi:Tol biopolymer transport system component/DNA-binding winged helix-turn-helix (wHTH) protein
LDVKDRKDEKPVRGQLRFGLFEADLEAGELHRSGLRVRLQSQPFRMLKVLLEHPGEVVSRETLQRELWGTDTTVDFDHGLGIAANKLREALGDSAENPRFVETLARRGYRFIAPVQVVEPEGVAAVPEILALPSKPIPGHWWLVGALAMLSLALLVLLLAGKGDRTPYQVAQITYSGHVLTNDLDVESFSGSASDGARIYFSHVDNGTPVLAVALIANGEISRIHLPSDIGAPLICGLSPDGSKLVVRSHLQTEPEQPLWIVPTLGGDARRIPNIEAHDATWMPDGKRLLVASRNDLLVVNQDGSDVRKLLTSPGLAFWLRWSPDGRRLRFTLRDPKRQTSELWEAAADGSHLHALLPGWSKPSSECCGSWTADGRQYVFQSTHSGRSNLWALAEHAWWPFASAPRQITNGPLEYAAPSTGPTGERVFFIGNTAQFELLRAMPHSSAFTELDPNLSAAALAQYSPDGQWLAWLNNSDLSLWRSRVDGSERIELTSPPLHIFNMKWSPDNRRLALMAYEPGKPWRIYLIDADGGNLKPLLNEELNEADPSWSPDGRSIVFGRPPERMANGQPRAIYILDLETRKANEIPGSTGLFSPRLSPDGRYLVALPIDQHALMLLDRSTGRWSALTAHGAGDPTWSADSHAVYFQDFLEPGKPIYRVSVPDGKLQQVATIANLLPVAATDFRLIGLAPGDLPVVTARTPAVDFYQLDLNER